MATNFDSIIMSVITSLLGSGGIAGVGFYFFRRYIDKKLTDEEAVAKENLKIKQQRMEIDRKLKNAYSKMFFWLYKYIQSENINLTIDGNKDLENAFNELQETEQLEKELDFYIISKYEKIEK